MTNGNDNSPGYHSNNYAQAPLSDVNQNHNQDVEAFLTSNIQPLVRVKQESDVDEGSWGAFDSTAGNVVPMNVISSNQPSPQSYSATQPQTRSSSSAAIYSDVNIKREENDTAVEITSSTELSKDATAESALQILLGINVDLLLSDELRQKVRKVQQCVLHGGDGAETGSGADDFTSTAQPSESKSKASVVGDKSQTAWKKGPNPMIGSTVYIFSGPYAGLSGRLVSENRSWYQIDNPALNGKSVKSLSCKLVDDGKMDVAAVTEFCTQRKRWLSIIKPGELNKQDEAAESRPGEKRSSAGGNNPVEETIKKQRSARSREMDNLRDFLRPGLHWLPPVQQRTSRVTASDIGINQNLRSMATTSNEPLVKARCWDDKHADTEGFHSELKPTHYCSVPENVSSIANLIKDELLRRFQPGWDGCNDLVLGAMEVTSGYFRGHIHNDISVQLRNCLPGNFLVKENAMQIAIAFYNSKDGQCETHFDRDSSALMLVSGYKEVKIAPPLSEPRPADGILDGVNPFCFDEKLHGGLKWETVHMGPGSVLIIPKYWVHCVKSTANTLALSFQIISAEGCSPPKRIWVQHGAGTTNENNSVQQSAVQAQATENVAAGSAYTVKSQLHVNQPEEKAASGTGYAKTASVKGRRKPKAEPTSPTIFTETIVKANQSNVRSKVKSETSMPFNGRIKIKSEVMSLSKRSSCRHVPTCAICSHGFDGREMWVLRYQGSVTPHYLPEYPLSLRKHLICKDCCPGNGSGMVYPWDIIDYPDGTQQCILSKAEFCEHESLGDIDYKKYAYVTASSIDYTARVVNKGNLV